jgi:hypothetical protein
MHEILASLASGILRFVLGLCEFLGVVLETDFDLTGGLFSAKTLVAVRHRLRRRRASLTATKGRVGTGGSHVP